MTIMGFKDNNKMGGIPNEIFTLVITSSMVDFNVWKILIEEASDRAYGNFQ